MCGEIQSHYLLIWFPDISFSLLRLFLHFALAMFFLRPLKRSDRQEAVRRACVRAVRDDRLTCRSTIKQIRWNTSSHKYKQYRGTPGQNLPTIDPPATTHQSVPNASGRGRGYTLERSPLHCRTAQRNTTHYEKWIPDWHRKLFQLMRWVSNSAEMNGTP